MRVIALIFLLLTVSACSEKPFAIQHVAEQSPVRQNTVFVDDHGWHTGFIIPAAQINAELPFLKARFDYATPYYEFGWGDKGFYQAQTITSGLTMRAMFWSSGSVVHVVAVPQSPKDYFPYSEIIAIQLSDKEFSDLRAFIKNSFAYDAGGNAIALQPGLYGDSQFYEGSGNYYILNTCNKWTAKGLKSAGMDISPALKLTAGSIMYYLRTQTAASAPPMQYSTQPRLPHPAY